MVIGLIASLGAAIAYPLMYILYAKAAKILVNYAKSQQVYNSTLKCDLIPYDQDYDEIIEENYRLYLMLGSVVFILKTLYYITWNVSSERQIKKIR